MSYTSYDHDRLEAAEKLKIERTIYFQSEKSDIAELTALPLAELIRQKEESAAAEEKIYSSLREQATAWEEQAGKTLSLEKAIEYARTPAVQHTSNKWQERDHDRREISNAVYRMNYYVYENTRYDREKKESVPYSYSLTWNVYTNGPERNRQIKIAGQDRKVFADRAAMEKYLAGRQKAYANLFTEVSPQIPKQYAECFKVNGVLLPGYTIEGEEIKKPEQAQAPAEQRTTTESKDEQFAILLDSRSRFETGEAGGYWLSMPATKEQLQEALASIGLTADNTQDLFIRGFSDTEEKRLVLPYDMVCSANIDELNFLAARLENLDVSAIAALNAAAQRKQGFENVGQIIDFTYNEDFFVHIPEVRTPAELGNYYLNKSGMVQMPDEWKTGVDLAAFGRNAAEKEKGSFTDYGYILESGDEWVKHYEGREVPEEYRIMSSAQAPQIDPAKVDMDISAVQTAEQIDVQTKEPKPVIPIILTSENPAGKLKEITDRLEQGITELFDSDRFKEYLQVMSKFHNYSFNNTLLIAIGGVALNQLTPAMVDKMFQQIIDKGLKPSTAAGAKRVLSVALSHARKYRYIETNAAKDTLTKFGKGDKTPDPYTPEQVKALMQRVEGTIWEMPVILGGLYGMRRSEILGLRWRNVDLENNTFDVSEQLPFKVPPKTKVIEDMAPPKSNGRTLPITDLARPFFLKQFVMQEEQKAQAAKEGKPYYDNDLVVAKPDGAPISASWVSSQFGKLLEELEMPHIRFHDLRHTAATNMHQLTGDFYTVGEVLGHTLAGIGASLGLSMNFEAVTARYVDVRLERKKEVLDAYHGALEKADPAKEAEPKKAKSAAKKKRAEIDL